MRVLVFSLLIILFCNTSASKNASEAFRDRILEHFEKQFGATLEEKNLLVLLQNLQLSFEYSNEEIIRSFAIQVPDDDLEDVRKKLIKENFDTVVVQTEQGLLKGRKVVSRKNGLKYYAFLGIPYAEKPERFQASVPVKPWKYIKDATMEGPCCWHHSRILEKPVGSEDCLFANINTPTLKEEGLPVIVWVHGGAFRFGVGSLMHNSPNRFMKNRVVVVSFNYRLGVFGFLSSETLDAPGNAGMKDVVEFLKWLKSNVKYFGGDPENITLYGISSAGSVIEYLLLSKMAKGLFQKAIIHSSTSQNSWAFNENPKLYTFRMALKLGTKTSNIDEAINTLKNSKPEDIINKEVDLFEEESPTLISTIFVPTAEETLPGVEPFLQESPEVLMRNGNFTKMPIMYGFNSDEGLMIANIYKSLENVDKLTEMFVPEDALPKSIKLRRRLVKLIEHFYSDNFKEFSGDFVFNMGVYKSVKEFIKHSEYPVYLYEFCYDGPLGVFRPTRYIFKGVSHADDLYYSMDQVFYPFTYTDRLTEAVADRQVMIYTNFAKYGKPIPNPNSGLPQWPPISDPKKLEFMKMCANLQMSSEPFKGRQKLWDFMYKNKS